MKREIKKRKPIKKFNETTSAIQQRITTLILAGFSLVAALAWNEAIRSLFQVFFEDKGGLIGKFSYAIVVTIIVVIISIRLQKISQTNKK